MIATVLAISFLNPWAIGLGAVAVALPVAIHWLTKPRPKRMPLSTVRFVQRIVQQRRARYRLRDILVLLLRGLAIACIAAAFARPLFGDKPLLAADDHPNVARVVLLDVSQSTAATADGTSAFERGRAVAIGYLQNRPGLTAAMLLAAAQPEPVLDRLSTNLAALRDGLSSATPRPQRLDVAAALNRAAELLAAAGESTKTELVILSDFQRSNWAAADFSVLPKETKIQLEPLAPPSPTPAANLAVLRVGVVGRLEQGREATLQTDVGNYSAAARDVTVAVTIGDVPFRLTGVCPPGVTTTLTAPITLPAAGWLAGRAELVDVDDALAADNTRAFVLRVAPPPMYALLTSESAKPHASSSHYVERALAARTNHSVTSANGVARERVVRVDPQRPDPEAMATAAAVIVDHPGQLSDDTVRALAGLMRRGRGVWYIAAESVDASNLKRLADAAGADLKLPVTFAPTPPGSDRRDLFLADFKKDQLPFAALGDTAAALLTPLRFAGGLQTERAAGGLIDDVVATYGDRSAALVVTPCGAGTLAILNADLARSSIISSPAFVPLVSELTGRLLNAHASVDSAPSGERMLAYLPPEAGTIEGLKLVETTNVAKSAAGDGVQAIDLGALLDSGGLTAWQWPAAGPPGVYAVKRGDATVFGVATAVPADESDLAALDPAVLKTRLAGGRKIEVASAATDRPRDTTWPWLLVACAACVAGESLVLKAFKT